MENYNCAYKTDEKAYQPKIIKAKVDVTMSAVSKDWPRRTLEITIDFSNSKKLTTDFSELLDKIQTILSEY